MGEPPPPAGEARTLEHQGIERHYYLQNIEAAASAPVPLVVSLHGYRGTDQALAERDELSQIAWEPLSRVADRERFIVAYPHAWLGRWSSSEGLENITLEDGRTVDDVGFVFGMIARLVDEGLVDPERVYLTGFSDGAIMSYRAALHRRGTLCRRRAQRRHDVSDTPRHLRGDRSDPPPGHRWYERQKRALRRLAVPDRTGALGPRDHGAFSPASRLHRPEDRPSVRPGCRGQQPRPRSRLDRLRGRERRQAAPGRRRRPQQAEPRASPRRLARVGRRPQP